MIAVVIPTRTDAYVSRLMASIECSEPGSVTEGKRRIVVGDNGLSAACRAAFPSVEFVPVPDPFVFARSVNNCVARTTDEDLLVLNDDTEILSGGFLMSLEAQLGLPAAMEYGVLSPQIVGGAGNPDQMWKGEEYDGIRMTRITICFIAAVIPRRVWDRVGALDERFIGYGTDDCDFCRRTVEAGWKLGVIGNVRVTHGAPTAGLTMSGTYRRLYGTEGHTRLSEQARRIFEDKWGLGPELGQYASGDSP